MNTSIIIMYCFQRKEEECGKITEIHYVSLNENFNHDDLVTLLKNTGMF